MIKVSLKDIEIFGYHGVYDKEREFGQNFLLIFHILVKNNFNNHSSDNINDVLDYVHVIEIIKKFIEAKDSGFKNIFYLKN